MVRPGRGGPASWGTIAYAAGTGGIWKTANAGVTWVPLFDQQATVAVNCLALAPSDPSIVWAGTGDFTNMLTHQPGRGVYRSRDGGVSWESMGLADGAVIARLAIDPRDPNVVLAGVLGTPARPGGSRGLYRTADGGRTWERTLAVNETTGVTDIAIDPSDPEVVYATTWEMITYANATLGRGSGTGVWRSDDGGRTWRRLSGGLPEAATTARLGIAVSPADGRVVYAVATVDIFDGATSRAGPSAIYRSDDGGEHWRRGAAVEADSYIGARIVAHPTDPRQVYLPGRGLEHSSDSGVTVTRIGGHSPWAPIGEMHLDVRTVAINPGDPSHLLAATDGGLWFTHDGGFQWSQWENLAIGQFYTVAVDRRRPYHVYGGTQDLALYSVPSRTRLDLGILREDGASYGGADAFHVVTDPVDTNVVYLQNGLPTRRIDHRTTEVRGAPVLTNPWGGRLAPLAVSPWRTNALYLGDTAVYRSLDRGENWTRISPRFLSASDSVTMPPGGGTIRRPTTLVRLRVVAESPRVAGLIYVGGGDGAMHRTRDGGRTWNALPPLPGVPARAEILAMVPSAHGAGVVYAVAAALGVGDPRPLAFRSADFGATWHSIAGNLGADLSATSLVEHPRAPRLLFLGTDRGVLVTLDGGTTWRPLGSGLPAVRVTAMAIQPRENDLAIATWGRGLWILDDLGSLEALATNPAAGPLFPVRPATAFIERSVLAGFRPAYGVALPNPEYGAWIHYRLTAADSTWLEVTDLAGRLVRRLPTPRDTGSVVWDLRDESPSMSSPSGRTKSGILVPPGSYLARLTIGDHRYQTPIRVVADAGAPGPSRCWTAAYRDRRSVGAAEARVRALRALVAEARTAGAPADQLTRVGEALGEAALVSLLVGVLEQSTEPLSQGQRAALRRSLTAIGRAERLLNAASLQRDR